MKYGVKNVVITDTATTIGYTLLSRTPNDIPIEAMIKANSPICVRLNPDCMAIRNGCPVMSMPAVPKIIMPTITTIDNTAIV